MFCETRFLSLASYHGGSTYIQIDQLKWENHQLQAENQKLHDTNVKEAARVNMEQELATAKTKLSELENICSGLSEDLRVTKEELREADVEIIQREEQQSSQQRLEEE